MMKKILALILAALMLFSLVACAAKPAEEPSQTQDETPAVQPAESTDEATPEEPETEEPAETTEADLSGTVTIYSTQTDVDHEVFLQVFNAHYPNVKVEFISGSIGELIARVDAEKENPQGDIIFGGLTQTDGDQYLNLLQEYTPKYADECGVESNGYYTYFTYQYVCLLKNTALLEELGVDVNGYADLLQPELKGQIMQADPSASSSAWRQLQTMLYLMGDDFGDEKAWDYQQQLMENCDGVITTSSSTCYKSVYNGEYAVGLTYDNGAIGLLMSGAEGVEIVWPEEGNTVCAFASAMIKNCPHPELAAAVLDTLSSAEFQLAREKVSGSRGSNTTYVNDESYFPADIDDGVVPMDFDMLVEQKSALLEKWSDMWATVNG